MWDKPEITDQMYVNHEDLNTLHIGPNFSVGGGARFSNGNSEKFVFPLYFCHFLQYPSSDLGTSDESERTLSLHPGYRFIFVLTVFIGS